MSQKIAFIDSNINLEYINEIISDRQSIGGILTVSEGQVILAQPSLSDLLSHATLCTKVFLDHVTCECEIYFINIWKNHGKNANINSLLLALTWCLENEIRLINLSIGTTSILEMPQLFKIVEEMNDKKIIIVAANSNHKKMTFPASFGSVISVKGVESFWGQLGFIYHESSIDQINIYCYMTEEIFEYKDRGYALSCANSLATPIITAKVCDLLSKGCDSLGRIKLNLKIQSLPIHGEQHKEIYQEYFEEQIQVPVIAIINNNDDVASIIQSLLLSFAVHDYRGICLSEESKTDILGKIINVMRFESYTPKEKLNFYTHYCNIDYVILEVSQNFIVEYLEDKDIDIIIYNSAVEQLKFKKKLYDIDFSEGKDVGVIFEQVYHNLLRE